MKTYVINLNDRTDRMSSFRESNDKILRSYERFEAFDGKKLTHKKLKGIGFDTDKSWRDPLLKRVLTWGEIGCFMSHYRLWEMCAEGDEAFLILEDDVVFHREPVEVSRFAQEHDLCFLVYSEQTKSGLIELSKELVRPCYPYWLAAYTLTPAAARKLVDTNIDGEIIPADEYVPRMTDRLDVVAMRNPPCYVRSRDEAGTSIEPRSESDYVIDFNTHVLTCGDDPSKMEMLFESSKKMGFAVENILRGEWKGGTMQGPGGGQKLNELLAYIEDNKLPDNDVILFTDAFDVFFARSLDVIIGRYLGFKHELVFGAEKTLWPDQSLRFPPVHTRYRYLNSGTFIGRVGELKRMLQEPIQDHEDDQLYLQKAYLTGRYDVKLDVEGYLFTTHDEQVEIRKGAVYNPVTRCFSCVYHGNGGDEAKKKLRELYNKAFPKAKFAEIKDFHVIAPEMLLVDFMTPEQCREYIRIAEEHGGFNPHPDDKFPSHDIHLKELGLWDEVDEHWRRYIAPICEKYWKPYAYYGMRKAFVMKYSADTQRTLGLHTDASLVTGSVKLSDDYDGCILEFPRQNITNKDVPIGKLILFPGQCTHGHHVTPLKTGVKHSLTIWTSRFKGDKLDP